MPVLNEQQAQAIVKGLRSGRIKPEDKERAMGMLREFAGQRDARAEFVKSKLDITPTADDLDEFPMAPKGFASEEARQEWFQANEDMRDPERAAHNAAARKGVDVRTGIDPEIAFKAGLLNFNNEKSAMAMEELLRAQMPEVPAGTPLLGNIEGVPVALQRQGERYKYVAINPVGKDQSDIGRFAAELPQITGEIIGGVAGATLGSAATPAGTTAGAVLGSATGSAVMAALTLDARVALARKLGISEDVLQDAVTSEDRLWYAGLAAAGDLFTAGLLGAIRSGINFKQGRSLTPEDVERAYDQTVESLKAADDYKTLTGKELPMSVGMITGDSKLIQAERAANAQAKGKKAMDLSVEAVERERAIQDSLREVTEQGVRTPKSDIRPVEEVAQDVVTGIRGETRAARETAETAQEELDNFTTIMDEARSPEVFTRVRDDVYGAAEASRKAERTAWDTYRKEVSWKPGEGSNIQFHSPAGSPIKNVLMDMEDDAQRALLESTRGAQEKFVRDAGLPEEGPTQGLAGEFLDPRELHFTLSELKRRVRQADRATDPDGFRVTDMKRMIGAIEETIQNQPMRYMRAGRTVPAEKQARVREAWNLANEQTIRTHSLFDNANMKSLLEVNPRTGELAMPQGMIYDNLFKPKDPRFLDDALESLGHNPQVKAQLAEELAKKHRNVTRTDFDGAAHRQFVDDHADHLRSLGINPATLRGARGLAEAANAAKQAAKRVADRLSRTFGQRISNETTDVVNVHDELMKLEPSKVGNLMSYLDNSAPDLAREVRDHSLVQIRRELASGGDTVIAFDKLWKYVDQNSGQLARMHGGEYVEALKVFKRMEQVLKRDNLKQSVIGQNAQPWFLDITRSLWGPLSKKQRFLSAIQRTNRRLNANRGRAVITKPEDLKKLVKLRNRSLNDVLRDQTISDALRDVIVAGQDAEATEDLVGQREATQVQTNQNTPGSSLVPGRPGPREAVTGREAEAPKRMNRAELRDMATSIATEMGLDPAIVHAQIMAESSWRPDAQAGTTSASGLMQLTKAAASDMGLAWEDRFDPEANMRAGMQYLKLQLDKFGNYPLALLAYHDGAGNVNAYLAGRKDPRTTFGGAGIKYVNKIYSDLGRAPQELRKVL